MIKMPLKFVYDGPIDNNLAFVCITAWRRIGDKPFPKPISIRFTEAYMLHEGEMRLDNRYFLNLVH